MYKIEELEKKSDHELNVLVADKEGVKWQVSAMDESEIYDVNTFDILDYCNSWADMGPIMSANEICTIYGSQTRSAATVQSGRLIQVTDNNELRAAAIVYLMME